jgi:pimeloyl-ACP methyl ester carboxylesterase
MKQINVVLMRGLLGKKYSKGMDALGAKIAKLPGVDYMTVEDYTSWRDIRDRVRRWNDDTVLIGHSFGANAATVIAESLLPDKKIPLIIAFDASPYWSWSLLQRGWSYIPSNVAKVVNF